MSELAELVGADALSAADRAYPGVADSFENNLVNQRVDESRSLAETLDRAWQVLSTLPAQELTMLPADMVAAHLRNSDGD